MSWSYGYVLLDRLTAAGRTGLSQGWSYDANGNRLSQTGTAASTYAMSGTSNRLNGVTGALSRSYGYDAAGNATADGSATFGYDGTGRLVSASKSGTSASYAHNALGQRVRKTVNGATTIFTFDESGHLLGEYEATGALIREYAWLGDIPVAVITGGPGTPPYVFWYLHSDHLNTPRSVENPTTGELVWRWDSTPFGETAPNEDPDGDLNLFTLPLRFPGQYADAETGLYYNYFRDYEPAIGRYVQSDPVGQLPYFHLTTVLRALLPTGLRTGYWNHLFAYVDNAPATAVDPFGLGLIDELAKKLGQKASEQIGAKAMSAILASGCIAENCKRGTRARSYLEAYGDCLSLLNRIMRKVGSGIVGGMQAATGVEAVVNQCAKTCREGLAESDCCNTGAQ